MSEITRRILMVTTSHSELGDTGERTGFHYEELTTPYYIFSDAGLDVDIASIEGGKPAHDPDSFDKDPDKRPPSVQRFISDDVAVQKLNHTKPVSDILAEHYDSIFLVGGHGTMWDFPDNAQLGQLISDFYADGKVIGAICHGPSGFIGVTMPDGSELIEGKRINSFTNAEEAKTGKEKIVPFLLESRLRELGADFQSSPPFQACVIRDDILVTGQNPASAKVVAETIIEAMEEKRRREAA